MHFVHRDQKSPVLKEINLSLVFSTRTGNSRVFPVQSNVFGTDNREFKYIYKATLGRGESCINRNSVRLHHMAMWAYPRRSVLYNTTLTYITQECG